MHIHELDYLLQHAYEWFTNYHPLQDLDWHLARDAFIGSINQQHYSSILQSIVSSAPPNLQHTMKTFFHQQTREKAILLFLISWNIDRFFRTFQGRINQQFLGNWENSLTLILNLSNSIIQLNYADAFNLVRNILRNASDQNENIITAKLLMVLAPNRFIAWDNQIAKCFYLNPSQPEDFALFNSLITDFIDRNRQIFNWLSAKYGYYPPRRLLDMVLFTHCNNKINDSNFQSLASKLIEKISEIK